MTRDNREFARLKQAIPVEILTSDRLVVQATTHDLSRGGLQIRCDSKSAEKLFVLKQRNANPHKYHELRVCLTLSFIARPPEELRAHCRIVYSDFNSDDETLIGLQFTSFKHNSDEHLEALILEARRYR